MPIKVLPQLLVNKISAGEVIERPANIVKELVENSIDAGAMRINITVEDGGKRLIAVSDNGKGMSPEDLELAFCPHATSKLDSEQDLQRIATMGFRGEALASIASVSRARIRTAQAGLAEGYEIQASAGSISQPKPCSVAPGTTATVEDLFFNTPARRKFLKTASTELSHISEQLARVAMALPGVGFTLTHNGRLLQRLDRVDSTTQRLADLFGNDLTAGLLPISPRKGEIRVTGLAGSPSAARASGQWQYFFVNGRFVRDRLLSHALKEAYRGLIDPNRWPVAFVFIELPTDQVDVNVHPTKIEVRFGDSQAVHAELLAALRETLNRSDLTARVCLPQDAKPAMQTQTDPSDRTGDQSLRQALLDFFRTSQPRQRGFGFIGRPDPPESADYGTYQNIAGPSTPDRSDQSTDTSSPAEGLLASVPQTADGLVQTSSPPVSKPQPSPSSDTHPPQELGDFLPQPIKAMQVNETYIVADTGDGLVIVDQHALHERIIYNDLRSRLTQGRLTAQRLLIPQVVNVSPQEASILAQNEELLGWLGLEITPFGPTSVAVQQFPLLLAQRGVDAGDFVRELVDLLAWGQSDQPEGLLDRLIQMCACKASVKAGQKLTDQEIQTLLAQQADCRQGSSCPHGRPTSIYLSLRELEKQFKRI